VLTYTYTWRVNGAVRQTTTTSSTTDAFGVRGSANNGDTIAVTVVATDGMASSDPATATAIVTPGGGPNGDR
jgi:hypothetical protein